MSEPLKYMRECEYCGAEFEVTIKRGTTPKYCRRSHRQRAYELAHGRKMGSKDAKGKGRWSE